MAVGLKTRFLKGIAEFLLYFKLLINCSLHIFFYFTLVLYLTWCDRCVMTRIKPRTLEQRFHLNSMSQLLIYLFAFLTVVS